MGKGLFKVFDTTKTDSLLAEIRDEPLGLGVSSSPSVGPQKSSRLPKPGYDVLNTVVDVFERVANSHDDKKQKGQHDADNHRPKEILGHHGRCLLRRRIASEQM
jgi:hypothetical protein